MWYINVPEVERIFGGRDPKINELKHPNIMKKVAMAIAGEI